MFLFLGISVLLLAVALLGRAALWKRLSAGLIGLAGLWFWIDPVLRLRSGEGWWTEPLWRNIVLYLLLLLGMLFRVVWEGLERANQGRGALEPAARPALSRWDFVRPALISLVVLQGVLLLAKNQELSWELGLASFQNGFFWHTLFGRTRAAFEGSPAKPAPEPAPIPPVGQQRPA